MATCFYTSQAEDFIPLSMTETPDHRLLRPSSRRQKLRISPELPTPKLLINDSAAAAIPPPRSHHKRFRDAIGDGDLNGDRFPEDRIPAKAQRCDSGIDFLILQQTTLDFAQKLKEKDEEIVRMGKVNQILREKVKTLTMENRIWYGLAQDNEAEADSLRSKLVRALIRGGGVDDAESSCGSTDLGTAGEEGGDAAAESRPART